MSRYPTNIIIASDDHFLRLVSLGNNDLYRGSVKFMNELSNNALDFVNSARMSIVDITIADCIVYFVIFLVLLLPLRSFFTSAMNRTTLLNELVPEIKRDELVWKEKYQTKLKAMDDGN